MAPSHSSDLKLTPHERELLLDIADAAIVDGFLGVRPSAPPDALLPGALREHVGVFVTLTVDGQLNGCIGSIDGVEPLGHGAARHAWSAAFGDPRLPRLRPVDYSRLRIEVSVLSPLTALLAVSPPPGSRPAAPRGRRPRHRCRLPPGTLPAGDVGAAPRARGIPRPSPVKVGLVPGWWPEGMRAWRFTAETFARDVGKQPNPSPGCLSQAGPSNCSAAVTTSSGGNARRAVEAAKRLVEQAQQKLNAAL
jgi:hypothetical protein